MLFLLKKNFLTETPTTFRQATNYATNAQLSVIRLVIATLITNITKMAIYDASGKD